MQIVGKYIQKTVLSNILSVLLVVVVLIVFIDMTQELSDVGKQSYTFIDALCVVLLKAPTTIYEIFPIAGFLGVLIGLGRMATNSELIIMRCSGVSVNRIAWIILKLSFAVVLCISILGEGIAPILQNKSIRLKNNALHLGHNQSNASNVWFYNEGRYIYIKNILSPSQLGEVVLYQFDNTNHLQEVISASSAHEIRTNQWSLVNARLMHFTKQKLKIENSINYTIALYISPKIISHNKKTILTGGSLSWLLKTIHYREYVGLSVVAYVFSFFRRLLQPLSTIIMLCVAVPFVFGSLRDSTMAVQCVVGLVVGFLFYIFNKLFGPVALLYGAPVFLSAALPLLFIIIGYIYLLRKVD